MTHFYHFLTLLLAWFVLPAMAQPAETADVEPVRFTVCALNVDGLPQKIAGIPVNADGPGAEGSALIGQYLAAKQYDILGFSEDFGYHDNLVAPLQDSYDMGQYRGGITGLHSDTDGLEFLVRKAYVMGEENWTPWSTSHGFVSGGADENIAKGYRHYAVTLAKNLVVDVYLLHMDADDDAEDRAARADQLEQLCQAVKMANNGRPKIIMGDTNCRYTRDDILGLLFSPLADSYDVRDAWVTLSKAGVYPALGSDALMVGDLGYKEGEVVDKIIYLNPKQGASLKALSIDFDESYTLGDHKPLVVTFQGTPALSQAAQPSNSWWVGEDLTADTSERYIYNVGKQLLISQDSKPVVTDIADAPLWTFTHQKDNAYQITSGDWVVWNRNFGGLSAGVSLNKKKPSFANLNMNLEAGTTRADAYKFHFSGRVMGIDDNLAYNAAKTQDQHNDWLLISEAQRQAYADYLATYGEALGYTDKNLPAAIRDSLLVLLDSAANGNYTSCAGDTGYTARLQDILGRIKGLSYEVTIPESQYATVCLDFDAALPEGVSAYIGTEYDRDRHHLGLMPFDGSVLPANTGVVLHAGQSGVYKLTFTADSAQAVNGNLLRGTNVALQVDDTARQHHTLYLLDDRITGVGFYRFAADAFVPAHCAYLPLSAADSAILAQSVDGVTFTDSPTAIASAVVPTGVAVQGVYTVDGRRVSAQRPGLYLVRMSDGTVRKVLAK